MSRLALPTALTCVPAALLITACSAGSDPAAQHAVAPGAPAAQSSSTAQEEATMSAIAQSAAARDGLEQIGADYMAALAEKGLPAPQNGTDATLAQVARGICAQLAAGTPEVEIWAQLRPVALYTVSQSGGQLDEAQASQIYLDAARSVC